MFQIVEEVSRKPSRILGNSKSKEGHLKKAEKNKEKTAKISQERVTDLVFVFITSY